MSPPGLVRIATDTLTRQQPRATVEEGRLFAIAVILTAQDVEYLLQMSPAIEALEQAYLHVYRDQAVMPTRIMMPVDRHAGKMALMPAFVDGDMEALGTKIVTGFNHNRSRGLPYIMALLVLNDPTSGKVLAIMDGEHLTAIKTAAASAIATKHLARADARTLGLLGAGVQARSHLWAIKEVRHLDRVKVFAPTRSGCRLFQEEIEKRFGLPVEITDSPEQVVAGSDIVTTVTTASSPMIQESWLADGVHVNAVDLHKLMDSRKIHRSKLVVETRAAYRQAIAAEIEQPELAAEPIYAEIPEIVAGEKPGRTDAREKTLYKAVGIAIQDVAIAHMVYKRAQQAGVGKVVDL